MDEITKLKDRDLVFIHQMIKGYDSSNGPEQDCIVGLKLALGLFNTKDYFTDTDVSIVREGLARIIHNLTVRPADTLTEVWLYLKKLENEQNNT